MSSQAFINLDPDWESARLRVASLTLLDRLVIALSKLGAEKIWILSQRSPQEIRPLLIQSRRRKIDLNILSESEIQSLIQQGVEWLVPDEVLWLAAPTFLAQAGDFVVHPDQSKVRWLFHGEQCDARNKSQIVWLSSSFPFSSSRIPSLVEFEAAEMDIVELPQGCISRPVRDSAEAESATEILWASLSSASDGLVDRYFNRPLGRPFSKILVGTPVTPNQVTWVAVLIGVLGAGFLSQPARWPTLLGAGLFQLSAIIDCIDGDLARVGLRESRLGKWLDITADQAVHIAVFLGIGVSVSQGPYADQLPAMALGISAAVGAAFSFGVVLWVMLSKTSSPRARSWVGSMANRDFSLLVIVLALVGRLDWFLWMVGVGVHFFWIGLGGLQVYDFATRSVGVRPENDLTQS